MHVLHDDGSKEEIGPGQAYVIEPGHVELERPSRLRSRPQVRTDVGISPHLGLA
jgi:hypothetical protein